MSLPPPARLIDSGKTGSRRLAQRLCIDCRGFSARASGVVLRLVTTGARPEGSLDSLVLTGDLAMQRTPSRQRQWALGTSEPRAITHQLVESRCAAMSTWRNAQGNQDSDGQHRSSEPSAPVKTPMRRMARRTRSRRHWQTHRIPSTASRSGYQAGNRTNAASDGRGAPGSSRSCRDRLPHRAYRAYGGGHSSDIKPCRQQGKASVKQAESAWGRFRCSPRLFVQAVPAASEAARTIARTTAVHGKQCGWIPDWLHWRTRHAGQQEPATRSKSK